MGKIRFCKLLAYKIMVIFAATLTLSSAQASSYAEHFNNLLSALQQSGFKTDDLWSFQDPFLGKRYFVLSEKQAPWAGNYFSMEQGGIAHRWQDSGYPALEGPFLNATTAARMTLQQIDKLSPIEKYDLYVGDYTFSGTRHELRHRGPYRDIPPQDWEGFCNGIRCAGFSLPEPQVAIEVLNPDGIEIRFQPSDLKALAGASFFYADKYSDLGRPSRGTEIAGNPPNAAAFDLALRYYLAVKKKAFVIDTHLGSEIWNESVVGFERKIGETQSLTKKEKRQFSYAVSKVQIDAEIYTLGEVAIAESNRPTKKQVSEGHFLTSVPVSYILYLDSSGKAVDGTWILNEGLKGVDFAWFAAGKGKDADYSPDNPNQWAQGTGNRNLSFEVVHRLFRKASSLLCRRAIEVR